MTLCLHKLADVMRNYRADDYARGSFISTSVTFGFGPQPGRSVAADDLDIFDKIVASLDNLTAKGRCRDLQDPCMMCIIADRFLRMWLFYAVVNPPGPHVVQLWGYHALYICKSMPTTGKHMAFEYSIAGLSDFWSQPHPGFDLRMWWRCLLIALPMHMQQDHCLSAELQSQSDSDLENKKLRFNSGLEAVRRRCLELVATPWTGREQIYCDIEDMRKLIALIPSWRR